MFEPPSTAPSPAYIYVLHGGDEFSLSEQVAALRDKMRQFAAGDYNITVLDGGDVSVDEVIAAGEAMPFLADRRMVIVRGLLSPKNGSAGKKGGRSRRRPTSKEGDPLARLIAWLPTVPPTTSLVFVEQEVADAVLAQLGPKGRVVIRKFEPPRGERLVQWLHGRAQRHGATLAPQAAQALAQVSDDLRRLDSEVAKLAAYRGEGAVQVEDVRLLVASAETSIFALLDAVAEHRSGEALSALKALQEQGQRPEAVLAQLASMLRRLLIVRELSTAGTVGASAAAAHGLNPYAVPKLQRQARTLRSENLEQALARLLEADRASKTGQMDAELALELAVGDLASGR